MAALKTYTLGMPASIYGDDLKNALGLPQHIRQANVFVVAATKKAAQALAGRTLGVIAPSMSNPDFRVAAGDDVDALAEAGALSEPCVLVTPKPGWPTDRGVVRVAEDGSTTLIGRLDRVGGFGRLQFAPAEGGA